MRIGTQYREQSQTGLCEFHGFNPTNHKTTFVQASTMRALAEFMDDSNEQWWELAVAPVEDRFGAEHNAVVAVPQDGPNSPGIFVPPGMTTRDCAGGDE